MESSMQTISPHRAKPEVVKPKRMVTISATATVYFSVHEDDLEKFTVAAAKAHVLGNDPDYMEVIKETMQADIIELPAGWPR
jgi:hypothetical protein